MDERPLSIPSDHPAFAGHFPGHPVVPGVVLLDEALSVIAAAERVEPGPWHLSAVKFQSPVTPGEPLLLRWQAVAPGGWRFEILAAGRRVATGSAQATDRQGAGTP